MGASKKIMEMFLMRRSLQQELSTARFANVAFSDGSLLHGFDQRLKKSQPIAAPNDIRRYFVTPQEAGELCLMSCLLGENRDIFFPKLSEHLHLITFSSIAEKYLTSLGYDPYLCSTEEEARALAKEPMTGKKWPCYFFKSDTTGEKDFEEFFTDKEQLDLERFENLGIIQNEAIFNDAKLNYFSDQIASFQQSQSWSRQDLISLFNEMIPGLNHKETGRFLDGKM
jgi:FlaA1/EpsC-like NDP-sugar epimerase